MNSPDHIRNVAVLGNLQHGMIDDQQRRWVGKTSFVDMLIESTHAKKWPLDSDVFTRLKCHPPRFITPILWKLSRTVTSAFRALLCPSCWKTVALIPTYWIWSIAPVTPTFLVKSQQVSPPLFLKICLALRLVDGVLLCVDVIEGVMMQTERCLRHVVDHHLPLIVVFTKMDRLITELRLPPSDAYLKIKAMLEKVKTTRKEFMRIDQWNHQISFSFLFFHHYQPHWEQCHFLQCKASLVLLSSLLC